MLATLLWVVGAVCVVEGLILALAPGRIDSLLDMLRQLPPETRRLLGLAALACGVALIWGARVLAG